MRENGKRARLERRSVTDWSPPARARRSWISAAFSGRLTGSGAVFSGSSGPAPSALVKPPTLQLPASAAPGSGTPTPSAAQSAQTQTALQGELTRLKNQLAQDLAGSVNRIGTGATQNAANAISPGSGFAAIPTTTKMLWLAGAGLLLGVVGLVVVLRRK